MMIMMYDLGRFGTSHTPSAEGAAAVEPIAHIVYVRFMRLTHWAGGPGECFRATISFFFHLTDSLNSQTRRPKNESPTHTAPDPGDVCVEM